MIPKASKWWNGTASSLASFLLVISCRAEPAGAPADPNASSEARAVIKYFWGLSAARSGKHIVSGQFTDFGPEADSRLLARVQAATSRWPGIAGVDYADLERGGLDYRKPNEIAVNYWRQGGLVAISAHLYNPANPNGGGLRDKGVDLMTLLDTNTETHKRWTLELDEIARGLTELKQARVAVLWRPFHEMNGGWFWWGAKDPAAFIRVWRQMFDYFSESKGLDNLVWVYSPNHGQRTAEYYPGDRYADLVGLDAYTDFVDRDHIKGYDEVAALPKPFGFTEYGPHGPKDPPGDYDYRKFLSGIEKDFPKTCFFMSWGANWGLATNQHTRELLADPRIINRQDLPRELTGVRN